MLDVPLTKTIAIFIIIDFFFSIEKGTRKNQLSLPIQNDDQSKTMSLVKVKRKIHTSDKNYKMDTDSVEGASKGKK